MIEIYQLVGEILESAQYIEWNIALSICSSQIEYDDADDLFKHMQNFTMGKIITCAKQTDIFNDDALEELEYILTKRNYLAHRFFKENDLIKLQNKSSFLQNKTGELNNILSRFEAFNQLLLKI